MSKVINESQHRTECLTDNKIQGETGFFFLSKIHSQGEGACKVETEHAEWLWPRGGDGWTDLESHQKVSSTNNMNIMVRNNLACVEDFEEHGLGNFQFMWVFCFSQKVSSTDYKILWSEFIWSWWTFSDYKVWNFSILLGLLHEVHICQDGLKFSIPPPGWYCSCVKLHWNYSSCTLLEQWLCNYTQQFPPRFNQPKLLWGLRT